MAHRMNPFTGRGLGTRDSPTATQNSHNRTHSNGREHPEKEQDIGTYQSYGGFAENSAYGAGDYSRPVPPTPGSINPFHYDADRSYGAPSRTGRDYNAEYADGYGARRSSFPKTPVPTYAGTSCGRRSRLEEQERIGHRRNALSDLTDEIPEPTPEPETEVNRRQPSAWRPHQRQPGDIEMQDLLNVDLDAQPPQSQRRHRHTNASTNNFWNSTANTASERSCWQGFWANTRGGCIGFTLAITVVMMLVVMFILLGVYYNSPDHHLKDE